MGCSILQRYWQQGRYRPNNRLYANSNEYAIHNNKGDQVYSIAAIWAIYHRMIMGPAEESVENQHSYCPNGDKTWSIYSLFLFCRHT